MSAYVVDASVAAKWFGREDMASSANTLLYGGNELNAPDFFFLETDNIICKWIRQGLITENAGGIARLFLHIVAIRVHPTSSLRDSAYAAAVQTRSSVYDCLYVSLAMVLNAPVVTADRRFYERLAKGPFAQHVVWLGDLA